mmetsp:Transcript_29057/g.92748  ORF Transcript_29057/g.92748 Transcript_29057/m.92748 type:complete len:206 (+) Transcript_29057:594-1211(+)
MHLVRVGEDPLGLGDALQHSAELRVVAELLVVGQLPVHVEVPVVVVHFVAQVNQPGECGPMLAIGLSAQHGHLLRGDLELIPHVRLYVEPALCGHLVGVVQAVIEVEDDSVEGGEWLPAGCRPAAVSQRQVSTRGMRSMRARSLRAFGSSRGAGDRTASWRREPWSRVVGRRWDATKGPLVWCCAGSTDAHGKDGWRPLGKGERL